MNSYLPFALFNDLQRDVNRLFDNRVEPYSSSGRWSPAVDIVESDAGYLLTMDVPGVSRESIDITIDSGVLTVSGERKVDHGEEAKVAINERWQGQFVRRFNLPDTVDEEQVAAKVENGVLALHIPKAAAAAPRKITVQ
ncbi:Hsp20/alpha crystallin family protein [Spongiibacter nanhainus]|uniref:Hsp20/alpha crystallin family protein n=1 Tax=Spongiibacter nanhainus TaxID=2794344 RepID=A0A7T4R183_9GAMM|nr:Hsp20/alpha crystallin family protein [Spongiibacter nanhainus]QQD18407.1 Hsp20/alpha crystallin family protein [Spongiibacter nanhainus]